MLPTFIVVGGQEYPLVYAKKGETITEVIKGENYTIDDGSTSMVGKRIFFQINGEVYVTPSPVKNTVGPTVSSGLMVYLVELEDGSFETIHIRRGGL